ncbi:unnamed protein product [Bemisia tabaci]|uniref:Uncharacterized protein n=1 Tax=Bemisia tabaci TaxID=7038 RepID=A0A9P0F557_BEMTA|nr:unnamed protein product [Bemisia tabaci]
MEVDKQLFKCWGCPTSEANPAKTIYHSSNGYYGYLPRNLSSEHQNQQVPNSEHSIRSILAGRKRTYNEMCSGVNYRGLDNQKSCKYRMNKVEETNNAGMVLG